MSVDGLPWNGWVPLPSVGLNHSYKPIIMSRGNGRMGVSIAKTSEIRAWEAEAAVELEARHIPILRHGDLITLRLAVTMPKNTLDIDSHIKATLDLLAGFLGRPHPDEKPRIRSGRPYIPRWTDLSVRLMVVHKIVSADDPGIAIRIDRYLSSVTGRVA